jgi:hypothetical protein
VDEGAGVQVTGQVVVAAVGCDPTTTPFVPPCVEGSMSLAHRIDAPTVRSHKRTHSAMAARSEGVR